MSDEQISLEEGAASEETQTEETTTEEITQETTSEQSQEEVKDNWGDDWRQNYAGEDDKMVKRLERYSSPKAALDALVAAQNKISSGELKTALQSDDYYEEITQWLADN